MGKLFQVIGAVWALIGMLNIMLMPWTTGSETLLTFGLMVNVLAFTFPGLGLYGVGAMMGRKDQAR